MLFDYPTALPSNPAILKYFSKKMPSKRKKKLEKSGRRWVGGGKAKGKSQDCCITFIPTLNILFFEVKKICLNVYIQNSIFTQELSNWGRPLSSTSQSLVHHWYANYVSFHTINYWELQWSSALEALTVYVCRHLEKFSVSRVYCQRLR